MVRQLRSCTLCALNWSLRDKQRKRKASHNGEFIIYTRPFMLRNVAGKHQERVFSGEPNHLAENEKNEICHFAIYYAVI